MSIKSEARSLGRMIRRVTGLKLPVAMALGKMVAQDKTGDEMNKKFPAQVEFKSRDTDCPCCSSEMETTIRGPRGFIVGGYQITKATITKEFRIQ
jgi:hypothetical protein